MILVQCLDLQSFSQTVTFGLDLFIHLLPVSRSTLCYRLHTVVAQVFRICQLSNGQGAEHLLTYLDNF